MTDYDFSATSPLTTTSELRAWAVAATAACASRGHTPRFLLCSSLRFGVEEWRLETRERSGLNRGVDGALLAALQRHWPTSGRTGGRTHLTALGIVRLVAGGRAAKEDAAAGDAEAERHRRAQSRVGRLDERLEQAFPGLSDSAFDARWRWRETANPELDGRTPEQAARDSDPGLEVALSMLQPLIAEREVRESAGWRLDLLPDSAARLDWSGWLASAERVSVPDGQTIVAHLHEHGRHVGVVTFHGVRGHSRAGRYCRIAWLLEDSQAAAAGERLSVAATEFVRVRTSPRPIGVPDRTPLEEFLTRHLLPLGRRAALAGVDTAG